jgi:hypothetical protein
MESNEIRASDSQASDMVSAQRLMCARLEKRHSEWIRNGRRTREDTSGKAQQEETK